MPDLSDETDGDTYLVVVEAKRVDGQTVCSEKTSLKTSKSMWSISMASVLMFFILVHVYKTAWRISTYLVFTAYM